MQLILNKYVDTELPFGSNVPSKEVDAEVFGFQTTIPNELIEFGIAIPFTVHNALSTNGAVRIYLDYLDPESRFLLGNGGQWVYNTMAPTNGRCSFTVKRVIPNIGSHVIFTRIATSSTLTILTLRARRTYQVTSFGPYNTNESFKNV